MTKRPDLIPLKSSAIQGYHYEPNSRALTVKFPSGDLDQYADVGIEKVEAMTGAASPGAYFNKRIAGLHTGKKVG